MSNELEKKIQIDFISVVAEAQEKYGQNDKRVVIEVCAALKKEISRLSPEDMEPYMKSADVNVRDSKVEITLAFPM